IGTLTSANYSFTFASGTLTITKATLTVTAADASRGYGDANPTFTANYSGFKNSDTFASGVTGAPSLATAATPASTPGAFPITAAIGTLASANYSFTFASGTLTVTKATLTVTADNTSRGYGDPNPTFTASYAGFKNSDTFASGVTGAPSLATAATPASTPGAFPITAAIGTLASANYSFTFAAGTLTVTKATLTVTADNTSRGYGDPNPTFAASYAGFKNSDTFASSVTGAPSLATAATPASTPGTFPITAAIGTLASVNYSFTFASGTLTVTKATLTVTADNTSRGYGDPNPTFTA